MKVLFQFTVDMPEGKEQRATAVVLQKLADWAAHLGDELPSLEGKVKLLEAKQQPEQLVLVDKAELEKLLEDALIASAWSTSRDVDGRAVSRSLQAYLNNMGARSV